MGIAILLNVVSDRDRKAPIYMVQIVSYKKIRLSVLFLLSCCITAHGFAQSTTTDISQSPATTSPTTSTDSSTINTTTAQLQNKWDSDKKISLSASLGYSEKVEVQEKVPRERGTEIGLSAGYKINDLYKVSTSFSLSQDLNGPKNTTASDTILGLTVKGVQINDQWQSLHSLSVVLPTSESSKDQDRLQTAIAVSNGLSYASDNLLARLRLSLSKNIHAYTQNADGKLLNEYRVGNSIDLIVPVTEKFSVSLSGLYSINLTYENNPKYGFGFDGDLNYDFNPNLSANLGMSNSGNALKANGTDSNITIYNEASAVFRTGISYVY
jgi:hypothetical protein